MKKGIFMGYDGDQMIFYDPDRDQVWQAPAGKRHVFAYASGIGAGSGALLLMGLMKILQSLHLHDPWRMEWTMGLIYGSQMVWLILAALSIWVINKKYLKLKDAQAGNKASLRAAINASNYTNFTQGKKKISLRVLSKASFVEILLILLVVISFAISNWIMAPQVLGDGSVLNCIWYNFIFGLVTVVALAELFGFRTLRWYLVVYNYQHRKNPVNRHLWQTLTYLLALIFSIGLLLILWHGHQEVMMQLGM